MKKNNSLLKILGIPLTVFALAAGAVLIASSFAAVDSDAKSVDPVQGQKTGVTVIDNDVNAHDSNFAQFKEEQNNGACNASDQSGCPETWSQQDSPEIQAQTAAIAGVPNDPADNPANREISVECPATGDCAPLIQQEITRARPTSADPIKILVSATGPDNKFFYGSTITLVSGVSIEGVNMPHLTRNKMNGGLFTILKNLENVSVRNFNINIRNGQPVTRGETAFFAHNAGTAKNVHVSNMKVYNGEYIIQSGLPGGRDVRRKGNGSSAADLNFWSGKAGGSADGLYIHNMAVSYLKRFVYFVGGSHKNIYVYNNNGLQMNRTFVESRFGQAALENVHVIDNNFNIVNVGHGNDTGTVKVIDFGSTGAQPKFKNIVIKGNKISSPDYKTPLFYLYNSDPSKRSVQQPQNKASIANPLLDIGSIDGFEISDNQFSDTGKDAITIKAHTTNGVIENNSFSNIGGQDINQISPVGSDVIIRGN